MDYYGRSKSGTNPNNIAIMIEEFALFNQPATELNG